MTDGQRIIEQWFERKKWQPFGWQRTVWQHCLENKKGLLNAPTGSGKTFALIMPMLINWINQHPESYQKKKNNGLQLLWITPLRALAKDLELHMQTVVDGHGKFSAGDVSGEAETKAADARSIDHDSRKSPYFTCTKRLSEAV